MRRISHSDPWKKGDSRGHPENTGFRAGALFGGLKNDEISLFDTLFYVLRVILVPRSPKRRDLAFIGKGGVQNFIPRTLIFSTLKVSGNFEFMKKHDFAKVAKKGVFGGVPRGEFLTPK